MSLAYIISGADYRQGDGMVATSPFGFIPVSGDAVQTITFADVSGRLNDWFDDPRYYAGDTAS